jgi:hypothetical protein
MMKPLFLLALSLGSIAAGQEQPAQSVSTGTGPTELMITYRCPPPRRAGFRQYISEFGIPRFERWKHDGMLKDYRILYNWYTDVDTWDAMAILSFPNYQQVIRWNEIEKANPGGLARDALEMAWPLNTYSADLLARATSDTPSDPTHSVFLVVPYDAAGGDYRDFANSYLIPQAKGWMHEGVLASYSVYMNRFAGGKRWQGLMLLEYKDADALGRREEVDAKVRSQLRADPAWRAAGEKHKSISEREPVIADSILPH